MAHLGSHWFVALSCLLFARLAGAQGAPFDPFAPAPNPSAEVPAPQTNPGPPPRLPAQQGIAEPPAEAAAPGDSAAQGIAPAIAPAALSTAEPSTWEIAERKPWLGPWSPPPAVETTDPLVPTAIAELIAGGALVLLGPVLWGTASTQATCGQIAGCFDELSQGGVMATEAGTSLLGIGIGLVATGGISLAITLADPVPAEKRRKNPAAATAGHLLTSVGLALVSGGFAYGAAADPYQTNFEPAWPLFLVGGICTAVGIPLLAVGAPVVGDEERTEERVRELRGRRSSRVLSPASWGVGLGSVWAEWRL